ncbi:MAG: hypothetical protein HY674_08830 [Chloroflexi bacterium]|nr:hypothetical protein [Chloroflexota bacterium]
MATRLFAAMPLLAVISSMALSLPAPRLELAARQAVSAPLAVRDLCREYHLHPFGMDGIKPRLS